MLDIGTTELDGSQVEYYRPADKEPRRIPRPIVQLRQPLENGRLGRERERDKRATPKAYGSNTGHGTSL
jgi:hypothetical protein